MHSKRDMTEYDGPIIDMRPNATIKNVRRFIKGLTPKNMARLSKASQERLQKAAKRLMR